MSRRGHPGERARVDDCRHVGEKLAVYFVDGVEQPGSGHPSTSGRQQVLGRTGLGTEAAASTELRMGGMKRNAVYERELY